MCVILLPHATRRMNADLKQVWRMHSQLYVSCESNSSEAATWYG